LFYTATAYSNATAVGYGLNYPNGSAVSFTAGTATGKWDVYVKNITANTSVNLNIQTGSGIASGNQTVTFRVLNTNIATLKNWSVVG
jgi:hypothetical protein